MDVEAKETRRLEYEDIVRRQLERLGEDTGRAGLVRTPIRVARTMDWLTRGYKTTLADAIGQGTFADEHDNMIMVRDIELYSLCEHHLLPFSGRPTSRTSRMAGSWACPSCRASSTCMPGGCKSRNA